MVNKRPVFISWQQQWIESNGICQVLFFYFKYQTLASDHSSLLNSPHISTSITLSYHCTTNDTWSWANTEPCNTTDLKGCWNKKWISYFSGKNINRVYFKQNTWKYIGSDDINVVYDNWSCLSFVSKCLHSAVYLEWKQIYMYVCT